MQADTSNHPIHALELIQCHKTHNEQELLALWRQDKDAMAPIPVHDGPGAPKRRKAGGDEDGDGNAAA